MDIEKLIEDLRGLLKQYGEKIPYGELVGAPWPYSRAGDLVWQDPEPYFIEQAATALSTFQAENEKLRVELENYRKGHCSEGGCAAEKDRDAVLAELEQVKRERDAAVEGLRVCSIENNMECQYCLYRTARSFCWNCTDGSNWKFRGQKEG